MPVRYYSALFAVEADTDEEASRALDGVTITTPDEITVDEFHYEGAIDEPDDSACTCPPGLAERGVPRRLPHPPPEGHLMDQTFSTDHRDTLLREIGGNLSIETMGILYRASHSDTFGVDLRAILSEALHRPGRGERSSDYHGALHTDAPFVHWALNERGQYWINGHAAYGWRGVKNCLLRRISWSARRRMGPRMRKDAR